jgi:hypothetical protein
MQLIQRSLLLSALAHHQELIKLYVQPWVFSCFPAVYRWCRWVGTVYFQPIYTSGRQQDSMTTPVVDIQFYKLLMMGGKTPETCRALIIIKNIV